MNNDRLAQRIKPPSAPTQPSRFAPQPAEPAAAQPESWPASDKPADQSDLQREPEPQPIFEPAATNAQPEPEPEPQPIFEPAAATAEPEPVPSIIALLPSEPASTIADDGPESEVLDTALEISVPDDSPPWDRPDDDGWSLGPPEPELPDFPQLSYWAPPPPEPEVLSDFGLVDPVLPEAENASEDSGPDDVHAPIAVDLVTNEVVAHVAPTDAVAAEPLDPRLQLFDVEPESTELQAESTEPQDEAAQLEVPDPESPRPGLLGPAGLPSARPAEFGGSSVFGDLFSAGLGREHGQDATEHEAVFEAVQPSIELHAGDEQATEATGDESADEPASEPPVESMADLGLLAHAAVDWPPIPTGLFPPLPHDLPKLNGEPPTDGELSISWPEQPRAQSFWPDTTAFERVEPSQPLATVERTAEIAPPPGLAETPPSLAEMEELEPELVFISPPTNRDRPIAQQAIDRPALIFVDPPEPQVFAEPATVQPETTFASARDGALARFASQASAFADRLPDQWLLTGGPRLSGVGDDAATRDLAEVQSPALTIVFSMVVIAVVLLFVYLVTPLLR